MRTMTSLDEQKEQQLALRRKTQSFHTASFPGRESYSSVIRNLAKSSGVYALASFISPLISLVLSPFLTHHLSRTDYGALAVLTTAIALMVGVTQLGLNHAFFRAYNCDYESQSDKLRIVSTLVALLLFFSIPTTIMVNLAAPQLSILLFNTPSFTNPVRVAVLIVLFQNLTLPAFAWLRAESRAVPFSALSILNLLVALSLNLALVGLLHLGITGSLLATEVGYGVVVVCTLPVVLLRAGLRPHRDVARNLLSFGVPLVSNFVSIWVLQLSDRYLLSRLGSLPQTASYAVAYSLGGVISVVVLSPFSLAWPTAMFTIAKRNDAPQVFQLIFRWFSLTLLFITFSFSLISMGLLFLFFPPAYHSAAPIIPIVAVSTMFYGIYSFFTTGIGVRRKNWLAVVFTTFSALLNIGLNLVLIPPYGAIGAAISTFIAYAVLALIAYVVNQRMYPIPYEIGTFILALSVGTALFAGSSFLARTEDVFAVCAIYSGALSLYSICLLVLVRPLPLIQTVMHKYRYQWAKGRSVL
jgi:O-antigen/teichoic acid export membrane protein